MRTWRNGPIDSSLPAKAERTCTGYSTLARRPDVQEFIKIIAKRTFPAEILDDILLDEICRYLVLFGLQEGTRRWRGLMTRTDLAMVRAVSMNVSRMKKEGLWAQ